mgnify:CR=1 FL=1
MKVGDLVRFRALPKAWGFVIKKDYGFESWVSGHNVILLEAK